MTDTTATGVFVADESDPTLLYQGDGHWGHNLADTLPAIAITDRPDKTVLVRVTYEVIEGAG